MHHVASLEDERQVPLEVVVAVLANVGMDILAMYQCVSRYKYTHSHDNTFLERAGHFHITACPFSSSFVLDDI